jgi:hypothetical protein
MGKNKNDQGRFVLIYEGLISLKINGRKLCVAHTNVQKPIITCNAEATALAKHNSHRISFFLFFSFSI